MGGGGGDGGGSRAGKAARGSGRFAVHVRAVRFVSGNLGELPEISGDVFQGAGRRQSWRYVFLAGLLPAAAAFVMRLFVREPERWKKAAANPNRLRFRNCLLLLTAP